MNLLIKYRSLSKSFKATIWFSIYSLIIQGISFFSTPIFTRLLTIEDFGFYNIFNTWSSILTVIVTLSLHQGFLNNLLSVNNVDSRNKVASIQFLTTIISIFFLFLFLIFKDIVISITGIPFSILLLLFLSFIFTPSLNYWILLNRYQLNYKKPIILLTLISISIPLISILGLLFISPSVFLRIYITVSINIFFSLIIYFSLFRNVKNLIDINLWKMAIYTNGPLVIHYLSEILLFSSDKILIQYFTGLLPVSIYTIGYSIASLITLITTLINFTFVPWHYKNLSNKAYSFTKLRTSKIINITFLYVILLILISPEILNFIAPIEYKVSINLIIPVSIGLFFAFLYQLYARYEILKKKTIFLLFGTIMSSIINIFLNILFIPIFGFVAAAYTTLISYILLFLFHNIIYILLIKKYEDGNDFYNHRHIYFITLTLFLIIPVLLLIMRYDFLRYSIIFLFIIFVLIFNKKISNYFIKF
jgi:O-antigen/teichoic acid export membrane protein